MRIPSVADLTGDAARRARFAATRAAIAQAIAEGVPRTTPTDEKIAALVKRARRVPRNPLGTMRVVLDMNMS